MIQNLKKKFLNREQIRGAMIFDFFSPGIPHVIKNSGCEFVIYDMEHGGLTLDKFKELSLISKGIGFFQGNSMKQCKLRQYSFSFNAHMFCCFAELIEEIETLSSDKIDPSILTFCFS